MANVYSWSKERADDTYHLPGPDHLGWWAAAAMLASILLHVVVFFLLDRFQIALPFSQARELSTAPVAIQQVEVRPLNDAPPVDNQPVAQPIPDSAALLDEIDLLRALPDNKEIDMKPEVIDPEYALQMSKPLQEGDPTALAQQAASNFEIEADLPQLGREPSKLPPAAVGQVTIDPGSMTAEDDNLGRLSDDLIKQGAGGKIEKGALDGVTSLDDLLDLPPNLLLSKKTMLPSDLLFEFNKAELRESAKVGLMKIALLMDRNPGLYCWIEGHTDLIGGDEPNLNLSIRRAASVKSYLVESLRMDAERISTRGFGKFSPIVRDGDRDTQAINRRVEIRMRETPPPSAQIRVVPREGTSNKTPAANTPNAILIQPSRAEPIEEPTEKTPPAEPVEEAPSAQPVEPEAPRAQPIEPEAPRAQPIEPEAPRAQPVEPEAPRAQAVE